MKKTIVKVALFLFLFWASGSAISAAPLDLQTPIPGGPASIAPCQEVGGAVVCEGIAQYIRTLYEWLVSLVVFLGVIVLAVGGVVWILAGGSEQRVNMAKSIIKHSVIGILLALGSYLILWTISPNLVQFRPIFLSRTINIPLQLQLIGKNVPPGQEGTVEQFKAAACPTASEQTFDGFFTVYYKPDYGDKGGYESFWCNVSMNCECPYGDKRDKTQVCKNSKGKMWYPCVPFLSRQKGGPDYCTNTFSGKPPQANYSLAADPACLKSGCMLEIKGKVYEVQDRGSWIKGRRFDLFAGNDVKNADFSGTQQIKVLDPSKCFR